MDNEEIVEKLNNGEGQRETEETAEPQRKFVVFSIGEKKFALPAEEVKEISFDNQIYFVPFLPPYVRGYANRHGSPFTVMDVQVLFENSPLESATLLILNIAHEQLALLISDVEEIIKVAESEVHSIASHDESSTYFSDSISVEETETFVLCTTTLLERLEHDIERI